MGLTLKVLLLLLNRRLSDLKPLPLLNFILEEVVEVCSAFARVAAEEIKAISIGDDSGS